MMKERLVRLLLITAVALLTLVSAKGLVGWQARQQAEGKSIALPNWSFEEIGRNVLGSVSQVLRPQETPLETKTEEESGGEENGQVWGSENEIGKEETEPIAEPAKKIQRQTDDLIESLKKLPEDQLKAIKRQLYKEFCEEILKEEEDEEE
jgi:hypothetical protein